MHVVSERDLFRLACYLIILITCNYGNRNTLIFHFGFAIAAYPSYSRETRERPTMHRLYS